jgi:lipopolysaccharide/colanic/teichoic acid biosynthesis glycosyltransferase
MINGDLILPQSTRNRSFWFDLSKRSIDVIGAGIGLLLMTPIILVCSFMVWRQDGHSPVYMAERVGRGGQLFRMMKLRSMQVGADRSGVTATSVDDPRITPLGHFLRRSKLDELPQLWNVLNGTMSLVGPRPALPQEVAQFDDELRTRDSVRPGVTGLWQLEGRDNPSFSAYRRFDLFYLENWSVTLDLVILLGTVEATIARLFRAMRDPGKDIQLAAVDVRPAGSTAEWSAAETATPVTIRS